MAVTKMDSQLYEAVRRHISKGARRFDYPTVKSFVDKAVYKMLKNERKKRYHSRD